MTDKSFYQAAAAEVAAGQLDSALWIKVNAEMPEAAIVARHAKYIQLRAQELSLESKAAVVSHGVRRARSMFRKVAKVGGVSLALYLVIGGIYLVWDKCNQVNKDVRAIAKSSDWSKDSSECENLGYEADGALAQILSTSGLMANVNAIRVANEQCRYDRMEYGMEMEWPILSPSSQYLDPKAVAYLSGKMQEYRAGNPSASPADALKYVRDKYAPLLDELTFRATGKQPNQF